MMLISFSGGNSKYPLTNTSEISVIIYEPMGIDADINEVSSTSTMEKFSRQTNKITILAVAVSLGLSACDTGSDLNNCDFDEAAMLSNYADEIIQPRFADLVTATTLLEGSVDAFVATPTAGLLTEARISYAAAYKQYQRCSSFAFGPGLINGSPFRDRSTRSYEYKLH